MTIDERCLDWYQWAVYPEQHPARDAASIRLTIANHRPCSEQELQSMNRALVIGLAFNPMTTREGRQILKRVHRHLRLTQ